MRRLWILLLFSMLLFQAASSAAPLKSNPLIAFSSDRAGSRIPDIYVMNQDGSDQRALTVRTEKGVTIHLGAVAPVWSPDGKKLAFVTPTDNLPNLYVISADGSDLRRLARNANNPTWSPDSEQIAFEKYMLQSKASGFARSSLYVVNADGSDQRLLTRGPARVSGGVRAPAWSPVGERIAFGTVRYTQKGFIYDDIYVVNTSGGGQRNLTRGSSSDYPPAWSPDGKSIAFIRGPHPSVNSFVEESFTAKNIYVMNADGGPLRLLTTQATIQVDAEHPTLSLAWRPDGKEIAYVAGATDAFYQREIWIVNVVGHERRLLPRRGNHPTWSPDSKRVAFVSVPPVPFNTEIYVMNADGGGQTRLTQNRAWDSYPAWQPR